jgi:hypothetical protein
MSFRSSSRSTKITRSAKLNGIIAEALKISASSKSNKLDAPVETPSPKIVIEDPIEEFVVKVQLPTYDFIDVPYYRSKSYQPKVIDLKNKICELCGGMDPRRLRLLHKYEELTDEDGLAVHNLANCVLQLVYRMANVSEESTQMEYRGFIRSVAPAEGSTNIPIAASVVLHIAPNKFGHVIRVPALLEYTALPLRYSGDMLLELQGNKKEATQRGFQQWTDRTQLERILLLEVDDHLDLRLESIRYYTYGVNAGYHGGDKHSWQRYTRNYPVECRITVTDLHEDDGGGEEHQLITLKPYEPLKYSTSYALLLCNNVPTVPVGSITAPWTAFTMGGTNEDKIFILRTEKAPG